MQAAAQRPTSNTAKGTVVRCPWRLYTQSRPLRSRPQVVGKAASMASLPLRCSWAAASEPISESLCGVEAVSRSLEGGRLWHVALLPIGPQSVKADTAAHQFTVMMLRTLTP